MKEGRWEIWKEKKSFQQFLTLELDSRFPLVRGKKRLERRGKSSDGRDGLWPWDVKSFVL